MTAREVIERIQQHVGVPWQAKTVDTFKAGDPDAPVTGIATTFMSTLNTLQRASQAGKNLVITHEPTFYNHVDALTDFVGDPVYEGKQAFIAKNRMVVWRFHDHWHARRPDGILFGMMKSLGWERYQSAENPRFFVLPHVSLKEFATDVRQKLNLRAMRVVGDPALPVSKVAINPGSTSLPWVMKGIQSPDADVLLYGESSEWQSVSYVQDAIAEGRKKALIILGHEASEENGMEECARWLKTFITEVPVAFLPAGEPFWTP